MTLEIKSEILLNLDEALPLEEVRDYFDQIKLDIRNDAIQRFPTDPLVGLKIGKAYKTLAYGAINYWYSYHCPEEFKDKFSLAAFGSTARGELCLHSDADILVINNDITTPSSQTRLVHNLESFLVETGFRPEIKVIDQNSISGQTTQDIVDTEIYSTAEHVLGSPQPVFDLSIQSENTAQKKALFTVIEQKNPRIHNLKHDGEEVFNIKWDPGGINDFMILKSIGRSYGSKAIGTVECLEDLQKNGKISPNQLDSLKQIYSEYLFFRNEMHFFAGEAAERLGPKTRRFISDSNPAMGSSEDIKTRLLAHKNNVHSIYSEVRGQFLIENGIDPHVYENFDQLPVEVQMVYANSSNPDHVGLAAWGTRNIEVLEAVLANRKDYSVLQAASRASYTTPAILKVIEEANRDNSSYGFSRLMLAVQNNADSELLVNLFKHTEPNSPRERKIRDIARRRLTHFHYDEENELGENLKRQVEIISFYPEPGITELLDDPSKTTEVTPGKLYLNYAGRLASGKNFDSFLRTAYMLHKSGHDFEAHIFGTLEPSYYKDLRLFWKLYGSDTSFIQKLKYHGQYNLSSLKDSVEEMKEVGTSIFLFSKGLTSKELVAMSQPIITSHSGNDDIADTGMASLDESQLGDPEYLNNLVNQVVEETQKTEFMNKAAASARNFVEERYGLNQWGSSMIAMLREVKPGSSSFTILGTAPLDSPHGPSSWSQNLLAYSSKYPDSKIGYESLYTSRPILFQTEPTGNFNADYSPSEIRKVQTDLGNLISTVMNTPSELEILDPIIDEFVVSLLNLSRHPGAIDILSHPDTKVAAQEAFAQFGMSEKQILYPIIACDELTSYGKPIRPLLRLAHIVEILQKDLPPADVNISFGTVHPLLAIREKVEKGTPYVYVDHILASQEPLVTAFMNSNYYSEEEKSWFSKIHSLIRKATQKHLDKYVALWEINQNIAIKQLGIPKEKVALLPIGVNTDFLKK